MEPGKMLKLLRPIYGLADKGAYWGRLLTNQLEQDLGVEAATGDPEILFKGIGK
jgi:hypothetical protein